MINRGDTVICIKSGPWKCIEGQLPSNNKMPYYKEQLVVKCVEIDIYGHWLEFNEYEGTYQKDCFRKLDPVKPADQEFINMIKPKVRS